MKVIFLKDVAKVGKRHDVKEVNNGYAQNFLLPRKLAEKATDKAIAELARRQKELVIEREVQEDLLMKNLEEIKGKVITIVSKANEKGSLFSSIHKKEILEAMKKEHRAEINEDFIILDKPIKNLGEFEIPIQISTPSNSGGQVKKSAFKLIVKNI
ncbi:MAG: 50S ribosomal protein L9 [Candidatus Nomurabacteria bacterium GW2011_GWA2_40_9]|uniref:Large ribosomal subunit protein bL9 n=1 Tax=Candidatus Nomurabacteria bacterium GW2011_GWA2_40_9 TaxID=1618734 RepID=A0A0G0W5D1_9BACT|nr:MAG: 50S ribosomal protein L9 [Candidatus Nomurabacteria bacterium GW2011_GWA2_40_9]